MSKEIEVNSGPLQECEVAIVGAGPVGLMVANLLGLAGVRVVVFERNKGLLGLPRAIAYDAETLRLFTQVGLFNGIAPGLIQNPHVRHLNARNVTLMAADFPVRSQFGTITGARGRDRRRRPGGPDDRKPAWLGGHPSCRSRTQQGTSRTAARDSI